MLQDVVFPPELSKGTYRARRDELKERLMVLQQQALKAKMGTVVIFEGWGAVSYTHLDVYKRQVRAPF